MKYYKSLAIVFFVFFVSCKKEIPSSPGAIVGPVNVCPGDSGVVYSIQPVDKATYYTWTIPQDATLISGQGTTSITIVFGSSSDRICVRANNKAETSEISCLEVKQGGVSNQWCQERTFAGVKRSQAVGFSIGNKGYVGTGCKAIGNVFSDFLKDFWEYDPDLNTWIQKADFGGVARYGAVGFSLNNKGYIGTGWNGTDYLSDFWAYDPQLNSWTSIANFGGEGRSEAFTFVIGSSVYVGGGNHENNLADLWEYNTVSNAWVAKARSPLPAQFSHSVAFSIENNGYVGTGWGHNNTYHKEFWQYNPADTSSGFDENNKPLGKWIPKADFAGVGRMLSIGFSIYGKGYIGGGADNSGYHKRDFWEYDPQFDKWSRKADFGGVARSSTASFTIENRGYVGTGYVNPAINALNDFWVYGQ